MLFRRLSEAISELASALEGGLEVSGDPVRIEQVEASLVAIRAEMEAMKALSEVNLQKAASERRNARSAEERTKYQLENADRSEQEVDPLSAEGLEGLPKEYTDFVQGLNGEAEHGEQLPLLQDDVEGPRRVSKKEIAMAIRRDRGY